MKESTSLLLNCLFLVIILVLDILFQLPIASPSQKRKRKKEQKDRKESQLHQLANSKKVNCTIADHNMEYILHKEGKLNKISIWHFWATCTSSISCTFSTFKGNMVVTIKDFLV
jgi:hypothetical protein